MTDTPDSELDTFHCPYCDRTESTETLLTLHVGEEHWGAATESERGDYRAAYEKESETLRSFRLRVVASLVVLYFGFLFLYSIVG